MPGRRNKRGRLSVKPFNPLNPHFIASRLAELDENPYDPRILGHLRKLYNKSDQPEKAQEMMGRITRIKDVIKNHQWEKLEYAAIRNPFNDEITTKNYQQGGDILDPMQKSALNLC